jgi:signal transduction histidine kinase
MTRFFSFLLYLLALWVGMAAFGAETARELRELPFAEMSAGRQVELRGTVVYLRDIPSDFNFSLHDATGGVMIYAKARTPLRPGQLVTVRGKTAMSVHGLRVDATAVEVVAEDSLPVPVETTMAEVREGRHEGQFAEMQGVIHAVRLESPEVRPQRLALDFGSRLRRLTVWISHYPGGAEQFRPGSLVRVQGVVVRWWNPRGQPQSINVLANAETDLRVLAAPVKPPLADIAVVQEWSGTDEETKLIRVRGVVTLVESTSGWVVIQEGSRALRVRTTGEFEVAGQAVGATVEADGFPALGHYTAELEDAVLRPARVGAEIAPIKAEPFSEAAAVLSGPGLLDRDARLISLPAQVQSLRQSDTHHVLQVLSGTHVITASLPFAEPLPAGVRAGSLLDLTGVCSLVLSEERRRLGRPPDGFSLHLRTASDILVRATGPWWTPQRLRLAFALTAGAAGLILFWAISLRHKNQRLHTAMEAQAHAEQALARERRRVADQLHDTLQQTLTAASLQLHAAVRSGPHTMEDAATAINLARDLVNRGQAEVRDAVWDLRMDEQASVNLGDLLRGLGYEMSRRSVLKITFCEDATGVLPAHIASQIVRITREALTNALKHAAARAISVTLSHDGEGMVLGITDDGDGFDARAVLSHFGPEQGHFGLSNMNERAASLGAILQIQSERGKGTSITLKIPSAAHLPQNLSIF